MPPHFLALAAVDATARLGAVGVKRGGTNALAGFRSTLSSCLSSERAAPLALIAIVAHFARCRHAEGPALPKNIRDRRPARARPNKLNAKGLAGDWAALSLKVSPRIRGLGAGRKGGPSGF